MKYSPALLLAVALALVGCKTPPPLSNEIGIRVKDGAIEAYSTKRTPIFGAMAIDQGGTTFTTPAAGVVWDEWRPISDARFQNVRRIWIIANVQVATNRPPVKMRGLWSNEVTDSNGNCEACQWDPYY
jgi:hypothetical protein